MITVKSKEIFLSFCYSKSLMQKFPKIIDNVQIFNDKIILNINKQFMFLAFCILKLHTFCQFEILIDITALDKMKKIYRYTLIYQLISINFNFRISLKIFINNLDFINSITDVYKSAGWLEREVWDLFGIFFSSHNDLRRILTDYGFNGFPLRKDFPLTGFVEINYNDDLKRIIYKPLQLTQEFRFFDFQSPWYAIEN